MDDVGEPVYKGRGSALGSSSAFGRSPRGEDDTRRAGLGRQRSREERTGCLRSERRALRAQVGPHPLPASQVTCRGNGPVIYRALGAFFCFNGQCLSWLSNRRSLLWLQKIIRFQYQLCLNDLMCTEST